MTGRCSRAIEESIDALNQRCDRTPLEGILSMPVQVAHTHTVYSTGRGEGVLSSPEDKLACFFVAGMLGMGDSLRESRRRDLRVIQIVGQRRVSDPARSQSIKSYMTTPPPALLPFTA